MLLSNHNSSPKQVLKEYEKTISELIADKERDKKALEAEVSKMQQEKDQAVEDLQVNSMLWSTLGWDTTFTL